MVQVLLLLLILLIIQRRNVLVILALRKFSITNTDTDTTTTDTTPETTTTDTTTPETTSMETSYNNAGAMKAQILEETRGKRGIYRARVNNSTGDTYIGSAENLGGPVSPSGANPTPCGEGKIT